MTPCPMSHSMAGQAIAERQSGDQRLRHTKQQQQQHRHNSKANIRVCCPLHLNSTQAPLVSLFCACQNSSAAFHVLRLSSTSQQRCLKVRQEEVTT